MPKTRWGHIADSVNGTCASPAAIAEKYGVEEDRVEDELGKAGLETCPGCGWWWWNSEMDAEGYCPDCSDND